MDILLVAIKFVVVLGVLITVHEWGHFAVARHFGVKVLRFSIGFGQTLWKTTDRQGTEFVIAAIPLGGYVRMLDERDESVTITDENKHTTLGSKPLWQRSLIIAAGPIVNLVFAALLYAGISLSGQQVLKPVIGEVVPESAAKLANVVVDHEIISVDDQPTPSWEAVGIALAQRLGDTGSVRLELVPANDIQQQGSAEVSGKGIGVGEGAIRQSSTLQVAIDGFMLSDSTAAPYQQLGLIPWQPAIPAEVRKVVADSPAAKAGLQAGDRIVAVDDEPVDGWRQWQAIVQAHPSMAMDVTVARTDLETSVESEVVLKLVPDTYQLDGGRVIGRVGVYPPVVNWPPYMLRTLDVGVGEALAQGVHKTIQFSGVILTSLGRMIVGDLSVKNLSGPITIATVVGDSAERGWVELLSFVAYLSVSLGVLNLLPIPVLDGGHLMFYAFEAVLGRPLSERVQNLALQIGLAIIFSFMTLAIVLDVGRFY